MLAGQIDDSRAQQADHKGKPRRPRAIILLTPCRSDPSEPQLDPTWLLHGHHHSLNFTSLGDDLLRMVLTRA